MAKTLTFPRDNEYVGLSYEQASRRAQEVCRLAGENGYTVAAYAHLALLVPIMKMAVV